MLPIVSYLLDLLQHIRYFSIQDQPFQIEDTQDEIFKQIVESVNLLIIQKKCGQILDIQENSFEEWNIEENSQEHQSLLIESLFSSINKANAESLKIIKNIDRFGLEKLPSDFSDLRLLNGECPFCKKVTHILKKCLLCPLISCSSCK